LDEIEKEEGSLDQHKLDMQANRNYTVKIQIKKEEQIYSPPGLRATNCIDCN
jgi:hypothetical protein